MQSRPSLTLRKPASPEAIAAFVGQDESEPQPSKPSAPAAPAAPVLRALPTITPSAPSAAPSFRRASRAIVERRTRPARRRTTVYLDVDVASRLAAVLAEQDQELSDAVNAAVRTWLEAK